MTNTQVDTAPLDARAWSRRLAEIPDAEYFEPIHPGEILHEDFLVAGGLTKYRLARDTGLTETQVGQIVAGRRNITAPTALRLAAYFGNSPRFWMGLQAEYDIRVAARALADELNTLPTVAWNEPEEPQTTTTKPAKRCYERRPNRSSHPVTV